VRRLLAGELVDASLLEYELDGHHLGLVACSDKARPLLQRLAGEVGCRSSSSSRRATSCGRGSEARGGRSTRPRSGTGLPRKGTPACRSSWESPSAGSPAGA
jgi:hypothetical protein